MYRLAVLVSGGGTNLQAILDRIADGSLQQVEVGVVIASKANISALKRAGDAGIPAHVIARSEYAQLSGWDRAVQEKLSRYQPDLVVLAGFLSLLGPEVIRCWQNRIINVHPSLIPAFCGPGYYGLKVHRAALDFGVKITGATVHLVDEQYDSGPIVLQKAVEVRDTDTPEILQRRVMAEAEQVILPRAIDLFSRGLIEIENGKTRIREAKS